MKRICVFCGSARGVRPDYADAARRLGRALASRHLALVYGGGRVGLMGEIANSVLDAGGDVVGVIPRSLYEMEVAHTGVTDLRVVDSMHERKALMADLSDGFIALPGGLGTLEELFEVLTWGQLGLHGKPCGLLEVEGYFEHLIAFLSHAVGERFLRAEHRGLLMVATCPAALLDRLAEHRPPRIEKWIDRSEL
jgi:uncharacterized protein (TIGR00730 family)